MLADFECYPRLGMGGRHTDQCADHALEWLRLWSESKQLPGSSVGPLAHGVALGFDMLCGGAATRFVDALAVVAVAPRAARAGGDRATIGADGPDDRSLWAQQQ